jgi:PAS domain S-box-containing protein
MHLMTPRISLRALIVEDDADARANLQDILELDDWHVDTAGSAQEVIKRTDWSDITVVILDRRLPDGDAEHLLPEIRRLAPEAAVIVVTGFVDLNDAILALRQGAADYLLKPINPDAMRASISRIVDGKRTQQALRESQERLRQERDFAESLIQTARMIVLLRDVKGRIVRFNLFFEELTGCTLEEVRGADYFERFVPENERAQIRSAFHTALELGRASWIGPLLNKTGGQRRIHWSAKVLSDSAGQTTGLLTCGLDITDLERAQQKVVQSERLAAIGQMMAGLAHESRNALQRSKACLEMLTLEVEDRPEALDLVARIQRAQEHLAMLYEEVRQYAAPINLRREPCDLSESWREVWSDLGHVHTVTHIELCEETCQTDLTCKIDRFAISQVWRNILENAIQVSPQQGRIAVRCAEADIEGRAAVRIGIADQGPGMTADQRKRVFEPFFTTKTKGTGLGMAIAHRIVSSHGGTIDVADRDGPGAEFIIVLPRDAP